MHQYNDLVRSNRYIVRKHASPGECDIPLHSLQEAGDDSDKVEV